MSQPLSPDSVVLDDERFRYAGVEERRYRVRVSTAATSLERAVVAKNINLHPADVVVCQCDGTAKAVNACVLGLRLGSEVTEIYLSEGRRNFHLPQFHKLTSYGSALTKVRARCAELARQTLHDFAT